jgi:hypothetical protein
MSNVDASITSKEGCLIHIVGNVEYSLIPPAITGFSGTITISGSGDCPNTSLTFGMAPPHGSSGEELDVSFDDKNLYKVSEVIWSKGTKPVPKILKEDIVNETLIKEFKRIADEISNCDDDVNVNVNVNVNVDYNKNKCC